MKATTSIAVLAGVFTFSGLASAQEKTGLDLGMRVGYAIPFGTSASTTGTAGGESGDLEFSRTIAGAIPIGLDVNYRVASMFAVGVYGQYGFGFLHEDSEENCDTTNLDCSVSDIRAGLQASYIAGLEGAEAWFGLTLGLERIATSVEGSTGSAKSVIMTLPDFGAQGGVAFEVTPTFLVGPFVSFSLGRISYGNVQFEGGSSHVHIPSENRRFHEWLTLGIRGNFTP